MLYTYRRYTDKLLDVFYLLLAVLLSELRENPRRKYWVTEEKHIARICVKDIIFWLHAPPFFVVAFFVYSLPQKIFAPENGGEGGLAPSWNPVSTALWSCFIVVWIKEQHLIVWIYWFLPPVSLLYFWITSLFLFQLQNYIKVQNVRQAWPYSDYPSLLLLTPWCSSWESFCKIHGEFWGKSCISCEWITLSTAGIVTVSVAPNGFSIFFTIYKWRFCSLTHSAVMNNLTISI